MSSKARLDIFGDFRNFEAISMDHKLLMDSILKSKEKTINEKKPRYIIEVTKENIDYCKFLTKKFDLRHLNNLRGNFILYENKYSFISSEIKYNPDENKVEEEEYDKNVELSIVVNCTDKIVKQQQKIFDLLWHISQPANEKIKEIEEDKKRILHPGNYDFSDKSLASEGGFIKDDDNKNTIQITRDNNYIKSLLVSGVYHAKSEILLTLSKLDHFKSYWNRDLEEGLKHAASNGVRIIILYPEDEKSNITKKDITNLVSTIGSNVHLEGISGPIGSVLIVDNSKILLIDDEKNDSSRNKDILGIYSNNKSIINNYGALFDILLNEKGVLNYVVETKNQLENSNKQLKETNKRLKSYSESQQEFINLAAHELRTPTQAILGYIELLDTEGIYEGRNRNYMNSIERNADRLSRLVEDLLDVSRIESHNIALYKEKINLVDLIELVIKDFKIDLQKKSEESERNGDNNYSKNIEISCSWNMDENKNSPSIFDVMIDKGKIIQVISNLINNSLHAIDNNKSNSNREGNSVMINIVKNMNNTTIQSHNNNNYPDFSKNELLITIKDTGKGIDPEMFPRLFEKFATNSPSGTGLGLYITKAIIEAHGGRIWAENNTNESGAKFSFTLPLI